MTEIVDYKVVTGIGINQINKEVNSCIKDDWTPLGGIAVNTTVENSPNMGRIQTVQYSQTLIKYAQK